MYEKDEDYGNVWAARKIAADMASEVFKVAPRAGTNCHPPFKSPITNPIVLDKIHAVVDAGAKEFASHEDVMAKLLGKA